MLLKVPHKPSGILWTVSVYSSFGAQPHTHNVWYFCVLSRQHAVPVGLRSCASDQSHWEVTQHVCVCVCVCGVVWLWVSVCLCVCGWGCAFEDLVFLNGSNLVYNRSVKHTYTHTNTDTHVCTHTHKHTHTQTNTQTGNVYTPTNMQ